MLSVISLLFENKITDIWGKNVYVWVCLLCWNNVVESLTNCLKGNVDLSNRFTSFRQIGMFKLSRLSKVNTQLLRCYSIKCRKNCDSWSAIFEFLYRLRVATYHNKDFSSLNMFWFFSALINNSLALFISAIKYTIRMTATMENNWIKTKTCYSFCNLICFDLNHITWHFSSYLILFYSISILVIRAIILIYILILHGFFHYIFSLVVYSFLFTTTSFFYSFIFHWFQSQDHSSVKIFKRREKRTHLDLEYWQGKCMEQNVNTIVLMRQIMIDSSTKYRE